MAEVSAQGATAPRCRLASGLDHGDRFFRYWDGFPAPPAPGEHVALSCGCVAVVETASGFPGSVQKRKLVLVVLRRAHG